MLLKGQYIGISINNIYVILKRIAGFSCWCNLFYMSPKRRHNFKKGSILDEQGLQS